MPTDLRSKTQNVPLRLDIEEDTILHHSSWRKRGITNLTVETPTRPQFPPDGRESLPRARWQTPEFIFYAFVAVFVVPFMFWVPMRLSDSTHPNYDLFFRRLSPGWIPGRLIDNSDAQYRSFRNNLIPLTSLASIFFVLSHLYNLVIRAYSTSRTPTLEKLNRIPFLALFSIAMIVFLHGFSALKVMVILLLNFLIAKLTCSSAGPKHLGPFLTWTFNCLVLYVNEVYGGYQFSQLHPSLSMMDTINGFYPRWHVNFNITMLRLVSFNMDYYWASHNPHRPIEDPTATLTTKQRPRTPHASDSYNFVNYVAYILYPPLYIGGPIITFNDFFWQFLRPPTSANAPTSRTATLFYLARFMFGLLTMELILHYMYVVAIKDSSAWLGDTPLELCMIGFWNLIIMWLKLLNPWRFFRLWALVDGVDAPENMVRCMANNYSTLGFWRSWHRSYNLWLLRYIYIPVGGARRVILSTLLVFTFVALWHDLSFRLLTWGWLVSLFIIPELTARWFFPSEKYGDYWWFRHLCALGAVFNILLMMTANLVGFVIGTEGMKYLIRKLIGSWQGLQSLFLACSCLFIGAQLMFEYREEERRKGIHRRY